jgi:Zn-dependent peptidase ImmA (M78 family)
MNVMLRRIRKKMRYLKRKVGSVHPQDIARYKRLPIIYKYDLPKGILGMFIPVKSKGVIYLRPDMPPEQEKFVLYHELFHAIMKHEGPSMTSEDNMYNPNWLQISKQEYEAHMGAACFLLDGLKISESMSFSYISKVTGCPERIVEQYFRLVSRSN